MRLFPAFVREKPLNQRFPMCIHRRPITPRALKLPFSVGNPGREGQFYPKMLFSGRFRFRFFFLFSFCAAAAFSGLFAALYSLAGSLTSFLVMYLLKKTRLFSVIGVSTAGGVFHNLGQLIVAMLAVSGPQLIHYMPVLIISGMIAGIIVGIGASILLDRIPEKLFRA